jgi:hypothetical protein
MKNLLTRKRERSSWKANIASRTPEGDRDREPTNAAPLVPDAFPTGIADCP